MPRRMPDECLNLKHSLVIQRWMCLHVLYRMRRCGQLVNISRPSVEDNVQGQSSQDDLLMNELPLLNICAFYIPIP